MDETIEWIARLRGLVDAHSTQIAERYRRMAVSTPIPFDNRIVRVAGGDAQVTPFGALPAELCILVWPESPDRPETGADQRLAAQLGAILSFVSNRRVHVAASEVLVPVEGTDSKVVVPSTLGDRSLWGPMPADTDEHFEVLLTQLLGLDAPDLDAIGSAIELHYAAAILVDTEPDAAYALVVAGIERLSAEYGAATTEWPQWEDAARMDQVFEDLNLEPAQRGRLRGEMLQNKQLRLRQTFASYATDSLAPEFWATTIADFVPQFELDQTGGSRFTGLVESETQPITSFVPQDPTVLRRRLLASYDRRSSFVHAGTRPAGVADLLPRVLGNNKRTDSLSFVGLRTLLRWLITSELRHRSRDAELPDIKLLH